MVYRIMRMLLAAIVAVAALECRLLFADDLLETRDAPRVFPFCMEGANLHRLWSQTWKIEPAGTGGFLSANGSNFVDENRFRRRFFGVNLYGPAAMPEKVDAPAMAERLSQWGINAVRVFPQYAWHLRKDRDYSKGIDPELLDRFDWMFFQLKQRGIYADINLHSARTAGYRFQDFKQTMKENKGIDNFDPTFILHQKEFARTIFEHVNPYTGIAYRDDPAVMTWEINNECSLAITWFKWNLEANLTPFFRSELERQFREWLVAKYGTTDRLREAWRVSEPLEPDMLPAGTWKDAAVFDSVHWQTEGYTPGEAPKEYVFDPLGGLVRIDTAKVRKFAISGVSLRAGQPYTVSFRIRSDKVGGAILSVSQNARPWHGQGCYKSLKTGTEWQNVCMRAAALVSDEDNRVQLQFTQKGAYEISDISIVRGGELGLDVDETLEDGTVGFGEERSFARFRDISEFILDTEDRYWKEMYTFVKEELGARAPVNCGTSDYGAHYPQAYGDFIDDHFYFGGSVRFPGRAWDMSNWSCLNCAIAHDLDVTTGQWNLQTIFENRVFGKPFTISEGSMLAQTATAADYYPIVLSVSAFQNLAAFHAYTWSHSQDHSYGSNRFLDMRGNAKYLAHLPAAVNMFVRGDVRSGESEGRCIAYELKRADERDAIIKTGFSRKTHYGETDPLACLKALTGRILVDILPQSDISVVPYGTPNGEPRSAVSSTGEICWDATVIGHERYAVDTQRTKFLSVFGPSGTAHSFSDGFMVTLGDTLMGWAAVSFTELSQGKSLLSATGYQQASGSMLAIYGEKDAMKPEDGVKSLGKRITSMGAMGNVPYDCEGVRATIRVPSMVALRVTPLDGDAKPLGEPLVSPSVGGFVTFDISEKYQTVWYLVEPLATPEGDAGEPKWISGGSSAPEAPAPILVKRFKLAEVPTKAELTLAVAGWHELSVNGQRVGEEILSPVTCQPDKRISSLARDVSQFLKKGENEVEILLGNGWFNCFTKEVWGFSEAPWIAAPMIRGELVVDGEVLFQTDGSWRVYDSPIVFNALRNGEYYDARKEGHHENERGATVEKYTPYAEVSSEDAAPCRMFDPIEPVRSFPAGDGGIIYDFGSNRTGWCEIDVIGESGAKVTIDYDEAITPTNTLQGAVTRFIRKANDPRPSQHDEYTLAGRPDGEKWHPRFTYHGFRYARVRTEGSVELKCIRSVFVHSDFASVGSFDISHALFAKLQDATRRSYLSNFTGIPTDCPHREKNGWTGDAQLAMETGLWNFDAKAGYVHFLRMMLDAQRPNGQVPCILPCTEKFGYKWGSGPAWDAALFEIPWQIYRFYGDDAPAKESYVAMKKYLSFIGGKARKDGLVEYGLGDWCAPKGVAKAPVLLTDSAYVYEFNRRAAFWAERFGENGVAEKCRSRAADIKAAFNREFYKGNGIYAGGELTSLAAPLYFKGLCADGEEKKVAAELVRRVREAGYHANFGILGAKWIPRVLSDYGSIEDAWRLFTQPDAPGWAVWMRGNDTLKESFDENSWTASRNHIMFGDLSAWAFEYLAGIKIDEPGFANCHVEPYLPDGVEAFNVSHKMPHGLVHVRVWRENGEVKYHVENPSLEERKFEN